jgi:hypothetical protein
VRQLKKGYVLEVQPNHLVVMTEEQEFVRLQKLTGVDAGEEILFSAKDLLDIPTAKKGPRGFVKTLKASKSIGIAAAMMLVVALSILTFGGGQDEAKYVLSFDVNPSVQIEVGDDEQVLEVLSLNEKARELDLERWEGNSLEAFLEAFLEKTGERGYLNDETAQVLISYADLLEDETSSQDFINRVTEQMQHYFAERNLTVDINMYLVEYENYERARLEGISLGRFQLIEAIHDEEAEPEMESEPAAEAPSEDAEDSKEEAEDKENPVDYDAYRDKPVKELLEHPVFERHPRERKAEGLHPVFDVHPRDRVREDEKDHPVFDQHPGNRDRDREDEKEHPVFEQHPGNRDRDRREDQDRDIEKDQDREKDQNPVDKDGAKETAPREEKEHPVFENHPRDRDKESNQHPVFETEPRERDSNEHPVFEQPPGERDSREEKNDHPVFESHPGERGRGRP